MDRGASWRITLASGEGSIAPRDIGGGGGSSLWGFPCSSVGKESACYAGDPGSIPGLGRSPGEEMATHSSILAWRIPRTEEPGGLQLML